jgi:hypothetical protein
MQPSTSTAAGQFSSTQAGSQQENPTWEQDEDVSKMEEEAGTKRVGGGGVTAQEKTGTATAAEESGWGALEGRKPAPIREAGRFVMSGASYSSCWPLADLPGQDTPLVRLSRRLPLEPSRCFGSIRKRPDRDRVRARARARAIRLSSMSRIAAVMR